MVPTRIQNKHTFTNVYWIVTIAFIFIRPPSDNRQPFISQIILNNSECSWVCLTPEDILKKNIMDNIFVTFYRDQQWTSFRYTVSETELSTRTLNVAVWHDKFGVNNFLGEVNLNCDHFEFSLPVQMQEYELAPKVFILTLTILHCYNKLTQSKLVV